MAQKSLYEQLLDGIGNAVNDIREKVVEEPWFGKVVTDSAPDLAHEPASTNLWQDKVRAAREQAEVEPAREPERDHGPGR